MVSTTAPRLASQGDDLQVLALPCLGPGLVPLAPFGHSRRRDDVGGAASDVPNDDPDEWKPL
jgi:hypothetical protein